jgi:hypothetical protein
VRKLDGGKGYLMYMIGGDVPAATDCTPGGNEDQLATRILVSHAPSITGPWSKPLGPILAQGKVAELASVTN